jgi:hypothetical protein
MSGVGRTPNWAHDVAKRELPQSENLSFTKPWSLSAALCRY